MNFLIICITYNSYENLHEYLSSIENAARKIDGNVTVFVADNSDIKDFSKQKTDFDKIIVKYFNFPNLGYFGSAFTIINKEKISLQYDYVLITNVDLKLDETFFIELQKINIDESVGWIAPDIISLSNNTHHNPYRTTRISKRSLQILAFFYKHPILMQIYQNTLYLLKIKKRVEVKNRVQIYAGHGSCFIFPSKFLNVRKFIEYPCFLFGEEIFIAEELNKIQMTTIFEPKLKVYDYDHVSTSKMKKKSYYDANYQAVTFLRKNYF